MTAELSHKQLRRAFDAVGELSELRELEEFPSTAARLLRQVIACEHAGYNAIDLPTGHATVVADPVECVFEGGPEALAEYGHQNPVIVAARNGNPGVLLLSDFLTPRQLHMTDLYHEVYRRAGLEYQMCAPLRQPAVRERAEVVGFSLARNRGDFTSADRRLLAVLMPHFAATLERLVDRALLRALSVLDGQHAERWMLLLDPHDQAVAWASPGAEEELGIHVGEPLPDTPREWLEGCQRTVSVQLDRHRLQLRLVPGAYPGLDALYLRRADPVTPAELEAMGLTARQAEVLALALEGHDTQMIAERLVLSRRTVEKHFESIYARLGVSSRAQALIVAQAAAGR